MSTTEEQTVTDISTDESVQAALMNLLEVKLDAFMGRADLSDSPPADKVAIRAAYFLGVSAGVSMINTIHKPAETPSSTEHDKDCDLFKQVRGIDSPKMQCTCKPSSAD